ncbi:MAG: hypothetical protein AAGH78_08460, partial [Cyanobacteria bacterium P01_H01_bin.58]
EFPYLHMGNRLEDVMLTWLGRPNSRMLLILLLRWQSLTQATAISGGYSIGFDSIMEFTTRRN